MSASDPKQLPYLVQAVLHNFPRVEASLRRRLPDLAMARTWRNEKSGPSVTLTVTSPVRDGRSVAEDLVARLRDLGFYAQVASVSPPAAYLAGGYFGERF